MCDEAAALIDIMRSIRDFIRPSLGSQEFINGD